MPRNLVFITFDSCRLDSALAAKAPNLNRLGEIEARWSYASWTAPSHCAYMMGLVPHKSQPHVYSSDVYKEDFRRWTDRLEIPRLQIETFLPEQSLPAMPRKQGDRNFARVSMPVLNPFTGVNRAFDDYRLMQNLNNFASMVKEIAFSDTQPSFWFLNLGETHLPLHAEGRRAAAYLWPARGDQGAGQGAGCRGGQVDRKEKSLEEFFSDSVMRGLHEQQIACVEYLDGLLGALYDKAPANTWFMIMGNHGEAFGEEGFFGHGPVMQRKVFDVPFVEGLRPS